MRLEMTMEADREVNPHEPRPVTVELCPLSRPDGSAQVCHGDTSVLAAVYGPGEIKMSKERLDKATVEVAYKPKVGLPGCSDRTPESLICRVCESMILSTLHPRTAITIVVQELQNSGAFLACCINAACMALLDAAVPLKHTIAAVSCCFQEDGELNIDPSAAQEATATSIMTFAFDSLLAGVVLASCTGNYTSQQYEKALHTCKQAAKNLFAVQRDAMTKKISKAV